MKITDKKVDTCKPSYHLMTDTQIEKIHQATLHLLENVGVKITNQDGIALLQDAGCNTTTDSIAKIPRSLVEDSIDSAPSQIDVFSRTGKLAMQLTGRNTYFGLGTDLVFTYDLNTGQLRKSVLQDVRNAAVITDYCKNVDFQASYALPEDVPPNSMYFECAKAQFENSTKPIFFTAAGKEDLAYIIEMAEIIMGGEQALREKPILIHYSEPLAPLTHSFGSVNKLLLCAEKRIPICYIPAVLLGASGPVTLAGGITQANAEALSGIVMHQLQSKGSPIITGWAVVPLDMKAATFCYGSPELRLTNSAFSDLYHHYKIPMWSIVGTDAHVLDQQAAMEHAFSNLLAALDGANLIHDIGYLGQGLIGDPAAIVMCDEMISYIKRFLRGFEISEDTIALDLIEKVGPGGEYLSERHTLQNFRKELWQPHYANRKDPEAWQKEGSRAYGEKVKQKAKDILKTHTPLQLPQDIQNKLQQLSKEVENSLKSKKFTA
ncbi:MAG: trimethylamine methyltransferase family protein [Candidatus Ranarchaeia archaeon]